MTELEQARAHLKDAQDSLHFERTGSDKVRVRYFERNVLSALSWVWDAQERAGILSAGDVIGNIRITAINSGELAIGQTIVWPDGREGRIVG